MTSKIGFISCHSGRLVSRYFTPSKRRCRIGISSLGMSIRGSVRILGFEHIFLQGDLTSARQQQAEPFAQRDAHPVLVKDKGGGGVLVVADALRLPFAAETFDAATVAFGLRNMESWTAALREMARVLRPGGRLLVSVPCRPGRCAGCIGHVPAQRSPAGDRRGDHTAWRSINTWATRSKSSPAGERMRELLAASGLEAMEQVPMGGVAGGPHRRGGESVRLGLSLSLSLRSDARPRLKSGSDYMVYEGPMADLAPHLETEKPPVSAALKCYLVTPPISPRLLILRGDRGAHGALFGQEAMALVVGGV